MARPIKEGLDYFPFDVVMDTKVELLEAEFGLKGFAVFVKLLQRIYGENGYYCEWNEEVELLFSKKVGESCNFVSEVLNAAIRRGIFNGDLFQKYEILTSSGIQKRFFDIAKRRTKIEVRNEYLLINNVKKEDNVSINLVNVCNNSKNEDDNTQRKVKESKVKESKESISRLWELYPFKQGKGNAVKKIPALITEYGFEQMERTIDRYQKYVEKRQAIDFPELKYQNGETFFNSGYVDYLDENFDESIMNIKKIVSGKKKQMIESDPSREQAYEELETKYAENPWGEE